MSAPAPVPADFNCTTHTIIHVPAGQTPDDRGRVHFTLYRARRAEILVSTFFENVEEWVAEDAARGCETTVIEVDQ